MKLRFEQNLDFQLQAIHSVCDLFRGQEICQTEFTVTMRLPDQQLTLGVADSDLGLGNRLTLLDDQILENVVAKGPLKLGHKQTPKSAQSRLGRFCCFRVRLWLAHG